MCGGILLHTFLRTKIPPSRGNGNNSKINFIEIVNILGSVCYKAPLDQSIINIDISGLTDGLYLVKTTFGAKPIKLIVQK